MVKDAIVGASYKDNVFDDTFEITDIEPEKETDNSPSEITLTLEYESMGKIEVSLEQFRNESGIEVIDVPADVQ